MIPDEAVTAAAKELWDVNEHDDVWVDDFATYDAFLRHKALMILEAATPSIAAQAWDQGWQKAHATEDHAMAGIFFNPYRKSNRAN